MWRGVVFVRIQLSRNLELEGGFHPIVIMHGGARRFGECGVEALWNQREKAESFGYRLRLHQPAVHCGRWISHCRDTAEGRFAWAADAV